MYELKRRKLQEHFLLLFHRLIHPISSSTSLRIANTIFKINFMAVASDLIQIFPKKKKNASDYFNFIK